MITEEQKEHRKQWRKQWRKDNPHAQAAYTKKWKKKNPEKVREYQAGYRKRQPLKARTATIVYQAIQKRQLFREPCAVCGRTEELHAHHHDYSEPLETIWLCREHHQILHNCNKEVIRAYSSLIQ